MANEGKTLGGAVIGYGGAFNMGRGHLEWMRGAGVVPTAACDIDPARMESAKEDFEVLRTYTSVTELLADDDVNLVTVITPHNSHLQQVILFYLHVLYTFQSFCGRSDSRPGGCLSLEVETRAP